MPLYDYRCHKCGQTFEVRQKFSDDELTVHDDCGGELEKLISAPAIQFKGTGWYVTDYGKSGSSPTSGTASGDGKSEAKSDSKSDAKSESKGDTKGEGKSETKTETKKESTPAPAPASTAKDK